MTVGKLGSGRETSPDCLAFSPSLLMMAVETERVCWDIKVWKSKGRGRRRLLWLNLAEATSG